MTKIAFQNGKVLARNDLVRVTESGNKCCCNCPRCIRNDEWQCHYTTQEECEQCSQVYKCWTIVGSEIVKNDVASCSECEGFYCETQNIGPCGSWETLHECVDVQWCNCCLPECLPALNVTEDTSDYLKSSFIQNPSDVLAGQPPWVDGWLESIGSCTLVWVTDIVTQTNATGKECGTFNGATQYAIRTWIRYRLFLVDCQTRTLRDVTAEALTEEYGYTVCMVPSDGNGLPLCGPPFCNDGPNPGFLSDSPTLNCP